VASENKIVLLSTDPKRIVGITTHPKNSNKLIKGFFLGSRILFLKTTRSMPVPNVLNYNLNERLFERFFVSK